MTTENAWFAKIGAPGRKPVLTGAVFAVTAAVLVAQLTDMAPLESFRRDAARIDDGQWWRLVTGMFFQDGGFVGGIFNLATLAILGFAAERVFGRGRWLLLYFGCGFFGQAMSYLWLNPVGAGNSMCVAGLLGGLTVVVLRSPASLVPARVRMAAFAVPVLAVADTVLHDNHGLPCLLGAVLTLLLPLPATDPGRARLAG